MRDIMSRAYFKVVWSRRKGDHCVRFWVGADAGLQWFSRLQLAITLTCRESEFRDVAEVVEFNEDFLKWPTQIIPAPVHLGYLPLS